MHYYGDFKGVDTVFCVVGSGSNPANIYSYLSSEIRLDLGNLTTSTFSDEIFGLVLVSNFEIKSRPVFGLEVVYFW